jgi:hypothetical protein
LAKECWSKNLAKNSEEKGVGNDTGSIGVNLNNKDEYLCSTTYKYGLEDPELWIHMTHNENILNNTDRVC